MTAINVFLRKDRAVMMTDGTLYTPAGDVTGFGPKARVMPTLNAVVATTGPQPVTEVMATTMPWAYPTFDAVLQRSERDLDIWLDQNEETLAGMDLSQFQIVAAGWSDARARPVAFSYMPGQWSEMDYWYSATPLPSEEDDADLHSIGSEIDVDATAANFDPVRHGIPFMEAQRRMKIDYRGRALNIVGGHIMVSEASRSGVSQRIIHRWPDVAGEPIRPEPFQRPRATVAPIASMSRQQRRAAEREVRKTLA